MPQRILLLASGDSGLTCQVRLALEPSGRIVGAAVVATRAELGAMSRAFFHDRRDFTAKRGAFLGKSIPHRPRAITAPTPALATQ